MGIFAGDDIKIVSDKVIEETNELLKTDNQNNVSSVDYSGYTEQGFTESQVNEIKGSVESAVNDLPGVPPVIEKVIRKCVKETFDYVNDKIIGIIQERIIVSVVHSPLDLVQHNVVISTLPKGIKSDVVYVAVPTPIISHTNPSAFTNVQIGNIFEVNWSVVEEQTDDNGLKSSFEIPKYFSSVISIVTPQVITLATPLPPLPDEYKWNIKRS